MSEVSFYNKFACSLSGMKMITMLKKVLKNATAEKTAIIFMCRKAYWLYRIFRMYSHEWKLEYDEITILTNRFIIKEDFSFLNEYKKIIIFDDTISSGRSLIEIYSYMIKRCPKEKIEIAIAYSTLTKDQLKDKMEQNLEATLVSDFFACLKIYHYALPKEMGGLSSQEILMFRKSAIPYVV